MNLKLKNNPILNKTELEPFLRACSPFRGGGSESDSDLEPDWDSEPDRAGRGFSSSESLSTTFFSDPDAESESESDVAFCDITEKRGIWRKEEITNCHDRKIFVRHIFDVQQNLMVHLFLPSASCFLCTSSSRFLLWCKILLDRLFSFRSPNNHIMLCLCVCAITWSLFLPESESEGVGSDSEGDPLSTSRSLDDPRTFFGGGGR